MMFALDSGATASIILWRASNKHKFELKPSNVMINSQNNAFEKVRGVIESAIIDIKVHICKLDLLVTNNEDYELLLGLDWFFATGSAFCPRYVWPNLYQSSN
jgi:hypothetical protein